MNDPEIKSQLKNKEITKLINIGPEITIALIDMTAIKIETGSTKTGDKNQGKEDPGLEIKSTIYIKIERNTIIEIEGSRKKKKPLRNGNEKKMRNFFINSEDSDSTVPPKAMKAKNQKTLKK